MLDPKEKQKLQAAINLINESLYHSQGELKMEVRDLLKEKIEVLDLLKEVVPQWNKEVKIFIKEFTK